MQETYEALWTIVVKSEKPWKSKKNNMRYIKTEGEKYGKNR